MTDVTADQSGAIAVPRLLFTGVIESVKQGIDALVGLWLIGTLFTLLFSAMGLGLERVFNLGNGPEFVFYGLLALFVWVLLIFGVVVPEKLIEFAAKDELLDKKERVNRELMRGSIEIMNVLHKGMIVLLATVPALILTDTSWAWLGPMFVFGVPVIEVATQVRYDWSPAFIGAFLIIVMMLPIIFIFGFGVYAIRQTPNAISRAAESLAQFIRAASTSHRESETLLDQLARQMRPPR